MSEKKFLKIQFSNQQRFFLDVYDIKKTLTINFKMFGPLLKKLPIRSIC